MIRLPGGSNSGGSGGGGAPSGSAGGSLTGTYPNPTIATIPSGATATTQSAADGSTKVATTAYVDTADALKANLAGPTFTGVVTLPTGTVATTQSAADNSTKLGTTAYIDTADALKANLASPTFTGTPTLPTGTILTTQTAGDSSTKAATTAFATTADKLRRKWHGVWLPWACEGSYGTLANINQVPAANSGRMTLFYAPISGTLTDVSIYCGAATTTTIDCGVYDCGVAVSGSYTRLWSYANDHSATPLSITSGNATTYISFGNPNLAIVQGTWYAMVLSCAESTTSTFLRLAGQNAAQATLPSTYLSIGPGLTAKYAATTAGSTHPVPSAYTDASLTGNTSSFAMIGLLT